MKKPVLMLFILLAMFTSYVNAAESVKLNFFIKNACYKVYQNDNFLNSFTGYSEALEYAKLWENATLTYDGAVWHNFEDAKKVGFAENKGNSPLITKPFEVYQLENFLTTEPDFISACEYAKKYANSFVCGEIILWDNYKPYYYWQGTKLFYCDNILTYLSAKKADELTSPLYKSGDIVVYNFTDECNHIIQNVPAISQLPQLPRGCEVTSLAMLLNYHGIDVSKMTLASEIEKVNHKADLNEGFIGDMYSFTTFGLGVYHSPIARLAEKYAPGRVEDITGCDFEALYYYISNDEPVWVINNSLFKELDESYFEYWYTATQRIKVTYKEHSVLVTGIDGNFVYINDPLTGGTRYINKENFIEGWIQMGRQAIVIV